MEQEELSRIADALAVGKVVENWSGIRHSDLEYVRSKEPNTLWRRLLPSGKWHVITSHETQPDQWGALVPRPDHPRQPQNPRSGLLV